MIGGPLSCASEVALENPTGDAPRENQKGEGEGRLVLVFLDIYFWRDWVVVLLHHPLLVGPNVKEYMRDSVIETITSACKT